SVPEDADTEAPLFLMPLEVIDEDEPGGPYELHLRIDSTDPDAALFAIHASPSDANVTGLYLAAGTALDFEVRSEYQILVGVVDGPHVREFPVQISIVDVPEAPVVDLEGSGAHGGDWNPIYVHGLGPQPLFSADLNITAD